MSQPDLSKLQHHIAFSSVGPTTLRNMGLPSGGRAQLCDIMSELDLTVIRKVGVARALEDWTTDLTATGAPWGPARKSLNLFLRDLTYNHWTRAHYDMAAFESDLELPLDGIVMTKVREFKNDLPLSSVKALSPAVSELYQSAASDFSRQQTTLRIHLDIEMWGGGSGSKKRVK